RPSAAVSESASPRRGIGVVRTLTGIVALAGGLVLAVVSASLPSDAAAGVSVATVFTFVLAVAMLGPLLIRLVAATIGRLLMLRSATGRLAAAGVSDSASRLAPVLSSIVLAIALGGSLWFVESSAEHTATTQSRDGIHATWVVTPGTAGLPATAAAAFEHAPGVTAVTAINHGAMFTPSEGLTDITAEGIEGSGTLVDLGVTTGSLADLRGDTIALDTVTAGDLHLHTGDTFVGWWPDGTPARLRVVATYRRGLGFASATVPHDALAAHTGGQDDQIFLAGAKPSTAALEAAAPGAVVLDATTYRSALDANVQQNGWTDRVITLVLLVYSAITAANALVTAGLARRREIAALRLAGTTRRQILAMVRREQVLLLGSALVLGTAIAAATLLPMVKATTGSAVPYLPPLDLIVLLGGTVALGTIATALPVRRILRTAPAAAAAARE
ncbi:MAG TPA: ABC transporter permease, partial [Micromonosporaceae bacterium]